MAVNPRSGGQSRFHVCAARKSRLLASRSTVAAARCAAAAVTCPGRVENVGGSLVRRGGVHVAFRGRLMGLLGVPVGFVGVALGQLHVVLGDRPTGKEVTAALDELRRPLGCAASSIRGPLARIHRPLAIACAFTAWPVTLRPSEARPGEIHVPEVYARWTWLPA